MQILGMSHNENYSQQLRATSHDNRRSRGHQFPPIKLQETKNSASRPFTFEAKLQRPSFSKMPTWQYFITKTMDSRRKFESDGNGNQTTVERPSIFFSSKNQKLTWSWPLDWRGCFEQRIKWDAPSFFGLWACPLEASHYAQLKAPIPTFYKLCIFSPFRWTLNKIWPFNPTASWLGWP
jgi:hypothetical protein